MSVPSDILLKINDLAAEEYKRGKIKSLEYRREGKKIKADCK